MQMVKGLMDALKGAGGGQDGGGKGAGPSMCACSGDPTITLDGSGGGPKGAADMSENIGTGNYLSQKKIGPNKKPCGQSKGANGQCINPTKNMSGQDVPYSISSGQFWQGR